MDATYWVSAPRESGIGIWSYGFAISNPWWVGVQIKASELWIWNPGSGRVRSPTFETLDSEILACGGCGFRIHNAECTILGSSGIEKSGFGSWEIQVRTQNFGSSWGSWNCSLELSSGFLNSESGPPEAGSLLRACLETSAQISRNR